MPKTFGPSAGRSPFQTAYVNELAAREDFDRFCIDPTCDEPYKGPTIFAFYTKDGTLHAYRVGTTRLLRITRHPAEETP